MVENKTNLPSPRPDVPVSDGVHLGLPEISPLLPLMRDILVVFQLLLRSQAQFSDLLVLLL